MKEQKNWMNEFNLFFKIYNNYNLLLILWYHSSIPQLKTLLKKILKKKF